MDQTWHLPVETESYDVEVYLWCRTDPLSPQDWICLRMSDQVGSGEFVGLVNAFSPLSPLMSHCSKADVAGKGLPFREKKTLGFEF